jgi:hypothetical protein
MINARSTANGKRPMANGRWSTVNGQWLTVNGSMVNSEQCHLLPAIDVEPQEAVIFGIELSQWSMVNVRSTVNGQRSMVENSQWSTVTCCPRLPLSLKRLSFLG